MGCVILKPDSIFDVLRAIPAPHLPEPAHTILVHIDKYAGKITLDKLVVDLPGLADYMTSCADAAVSGESAVMVARALAPALRKDYIKTLLTTSLSNLDAGGDPDAIVRAVLSEIDRGKNDTVLDMQTAFNKAIEVINKKVSGTLRGWSSGLTTLDDVLGKLWGGDLCVIAGRPGMGKTAFALCMAMHNASLGEPVGFFSLEMTPEQLMTRAISMASNIPFHLMHTGKLTQDQINRIKSTEMFFKSMPLYILPSSTPSMYDIQREAIRLQKQHGVRMIVIDYLQRVAHPAHLRGQLDAAVGANCKVAKTIAKEIDGVVVLLSQLNRLSERTDDKRPGLHNLRDSGNIEQEADSVIFLYRKDYYTKENTGHVEFLIEKNRHGKTGIAKGFFDGDHLYFSIKEDRSWN